MEAAIKQNDAAENISLRKEIYGSFFLDQTEIAVDIANVQEVVNFPSETIELPLAPEFMVGVFKLRDMIIPIINLKKLMNLSEDSNTARQKVAIIEFGDSRIGFVFDSTGSILRPRSEETYDFHYHGDSDIRVITGVLKMNEGARLVQILDPQMLVSLKNVPKVDKNKFRGGSLFNAHRHASRRKCISFFVSKMRLAFEITEIQEIINRPVIKNGSLTSELCLGVINLRDHIIPVVHFSRLLKAKEISSANEADQKVIIIKSADELLGLLVDCVEDISTYSDESIMPIPLLSDEKVDLFQGVINLPDMSDVILLNAPRILNSEELLEVTRGHSKLFQANSTSKGTRRESSGRQAFISFRVGHLFAISLSEVREIINYAGEILETPGMPSFVDGILNLRGNLVTIINTRNLYGIKEGHSVVNEISQASENNAGESLKKILVLQKGDERFGFVVDAVDAILHVSIQDRMNLPELLAKNLDRFIRQDVKEIIQNSTSEENGRALMVLDISCLVERIRVSLAEKA